VASAGGESGARSRAAQPADPAADARPPSGDAAASPASAPPRGAAAGVWVSTTYFAEGFPYSVVNNLADILFKELGASLQAIGLTALFHLPWNLKFLWGPFLDRYETKRRWLLACEVMLSIALVVLAALAVAAPSLPLLSAWFLVLALLSATHDMAIDGYYLEALDERGQSAYVGYRATAYKIAAVLVGGPLLILAGSVGWGTALGAVAAIMVAITAFHALRLPDVERRGLPGRALAAAVGKSPVAWLAFAAALVCGGLAVALAVPGSGLAGLGSAVGGALAGIPVVGEISLAGWIGLSLLAALAVLLALLPRLRARFAERDSPYARAFLDFLAQPHVGRILVFIVLFRAGESFLVKMRWPFLRDDAGMALDQYGFANGTLGVAASFVATFVGGWLIARDGLRRWMWPFVLLQNVLNLLYAWLAALDRPAEVGLPLLTAIIAVEQFGSGLGTAVFMVYLMRCCDPAHKAAHMAIVTALMSVSFTLAGVASGFLAGALGFAPYFAFTFAISVPAMLLLPFLPHLDGREAAR
jgi:PAT family beta-lactamase induction signal transducer AmpG